MQIIVLILSTFFFCAAGIVLTFPENNEMSGPYQKFSIDRDDYVVLKLKDNQQPIQISTSKEESEIRVKRYLNLNEINLHKVAWLGRNDGRVYPKNHKFYYWDRARRKMLSVVEESSENKFN